MFSKLATPCFAKVSALKPFVKLRPHQEEAIQFIQENDGRGLLAHGTGSGKTLSGIAAFETLREDNKAERALVITPASLQENFEQEGVKKFTNSSVSMGADGKSDYQIMSLSKFRRDPHKALQDAKADTIIVDEIHRAKNKQSVTNKALREVTMDVKNFIGMTGSFVSNHPKEVVPLLDAISPEHSMGSERGFKKTYTKQEQIKGGFLKGPRTRTELQKKKVLAPELSKYLHFLGHEDLVNDMPAIHKEDIHVEMSPEQTRLYKYTLGKLSRKQRRAIRLGLPTNQSEAQHIFAAITKARQVSNSISTHKKDMTLEQSSEETPKIRRVMDDVEAHLKRTPDGQAVVYSNLVQGGADVLQAGFKNRGITPGIFAGGGALGGTVTKETRSKAVADFNKGKKKVIILTPAAGEGISLNNATAFFQVDRHYNPERNEQAIARGRRMGGQAHRKPEDRKLEVKRYFSNPLPTLTQRLFGTSEKGIDSWIDSVAIEKDRLNTDLRKVVRRRKDMSKSASPFWSKMKQLHEDTLEKSAIPSWMLNWKNLGNASKLRLAESMSTPIHELETLVKGSLGVSGKGARGLEASTRLPSEIVALRKAKEVSRGGSLISSAPSTAAQEAQAERLVKSYENAPNVVQANQDLSRSMTQFSRPDFVNSATQSVPNIVKPVADDLVHKLMLRTNPAYQGAPEARTVAMGTMGNHPPSLKAGVLNHELGEYNTMNRAARQGKDILSGGTLGGISTLGVGSHMGVDPILAEIESSARFGGKAMKRGIGGTFMGDTSFAGEPNIEDAITQFGGTRHRPVQQNSRASRKLERVAHERYKEVGEFPYRQFGIKPPTGVNNRSIAMLARPNVDSLGDAYADKLHEAAGKVRSKIGDVTERVSSAVKGKPEGMFSNIRTRVGNLVSRGGNRVADTAANTVHPGGKYLEQNFGTSKPWEAENMMNRLHSGPASRSDAKMEMFVNNNLKKTSSALTKEAVSLLERVSAMQAMSPQAAKGIENMAAMAPVQNRMMVARSFAGNVADSLDEMDPSMRALVMQRIMSGSGSKPADMSSMAAPPPVNFGKFAYSDRVHTQLMRSVAEGLGVGPGAQEVLVGAGIWVPDDLHKPSSSIEDVASDLCDVVVGRKDYGELSSILVRAAIGAHKEIDDRYHEQENEPMDEVTPDDLDHANSYGTRLKEATLAKVNEDIPVGDTMASIMLKGVLYRDPTDGVDTTKVAGVPVWRRILKNAPSRGDGNLGKGYLDVGRRAISGI